MLKTLQQKLVLNAFCVIGSLVLGGLLFASGYWVGKHSPDNVPTTSVSMPSSTLSHPTMVTNFAHLTATSSNPVNVTPEMKEFEENRAALSARMVELRSHGKPTPQAIADFQKQNADLLKRQRDLGKIIAQQNAKNPVPTPVPLQIPPDASPQLKTFLTERDQLMRDQIAFVNQHRNDEPVARQAAVQQWRQQNASRFQQLQKDALALQQASAAKPVAQASSATGK